MHWAAHLIGKPYKAGACGPDSFDCFGLVRYYFEQRHGISLPAWQVGQLGVGQVARAARMAGWRRVVGAPQGEDVLLMENFLGRHVGIVTTCSEGLGLLHAVGAGDRGAVIWQPLPELHSYKKFQTWRAL